MTIQLARAIATIAVVTSLFATSTAAHAASEATWVSSQGTDAGSCNSTSPCRTFSYAQTQTLASGTINVSTAGEFGRVEITKDLSIVADGVEATIQNAGPCSFPNGGSAAICINAGVGVGIVNLRGLNIDLHGSGTTTGISIGAGSAVHIQNVLIRNMKYGINFAPAAAMDLFVNDSLIANQATYGILVRPTGTAKVRAFIDRVRVQTANYGILVENGARSGGNIDAIIRDSVVTANTTVGILANASVAAATVRVMIDRTASASNGTGVAAKGAGTTVRIGDSTVTANATGVAATNSAAIISFGSNKISGNTTNGAPTGTDLYQ